MKLISNLGDYHSTGVVICLSYRTSFTSNKRPIIDPEPSLPEENSVRKITVSRGLLRPLRDEELEPRKVMRE